jgi:hypothetical protein
MGAGGELTPGGPRSRQFATLTATSQAQAEATKAAQRAGIEHAKQNDARAYLGRTQASLGSSSSKCAPCLGNTRWASLGSQRKLA